MYVYTCICNKLRRAREESATGGGGEEEELWAAKLRIERLEESLAREEEATCALREKNRLLELERRRMRSILEDQRHKHAQALSVSAAHEHRVSELRHVSKLQVYMESRLRKVHDMLQTKPHQSRHLLQKVVEELLVLSQKLKQQ